MSGNYAAVTVRQLSYMAMPFEQMMPVEKDSLFLAFGGFGGID